MNAREYQRLKDEAASEYRRKLDAIEMVWKMSGGTGKDIGADAVPISKGSLHQAVKDALICISGEFNVRDVDKEIKSANPGLAAKIKRPSLSSALKRLEDEKIIVLVSRGVGKRASRYRKAG